MKLRSSVLQENQPIPQKYTCLGENINPPLEFEDIPSKTKSLALLFEDSDATPVPWIHWLVFTIPPTTTRIEEGSIPKDGTEGLANNKSFGYEGPCPKYFTGVHHYYFRLFALDTILKIPKTSDKEAV